MHRKEPYFSYTRTCPKNWWKIRKVLQRNDIFYHKNVNFSYAFFQKLVNRHHRKTILSTKTIYTSYERVENESVTSVIINRDFANGHTADNLKRVNSYTVGQSEKVPNLHIKSQNQAKQISKKSCYYQTFTENKPLFSC